MMVMKTVLIYIRIETQAFVNSVFFTHTPSKTCFSADKSDFSELTSGEKDKCAGGLHANAFAFFGIFQLMNLRGNF